MSGNIAERGTRPENCVLGFGIPTSEEAFQESVHDRGPRFAKKFSGTSGRTKYWTDVIRPYRRLVARTKKLGVEIIPRLTLSDFCRQFHREDVQVVILFSHWGQLEQRQDAVEFHEGFVRVDEIVSGVPENASKIIDLCVCRPASLFEELLRRRPRCIVRFNPGNDDADQRNASMGLTPDFWLYFYATLFRYLRGGRMNYLEANKRLILTALERYANRERNSS